MSNICGNIFGTIQTGTAAKNDLLESVTSWSDSFTINGLLSLSSGTSNYGNYQSKIEESTHVFLSDYDPDVYALSLPDPVTGSGRALRMIIKGVVYDILLIDNPDEMNEQLEIYLRRVGGWIG